MFSKIYVSTKIAGKKVRDVVSDSVYPVFEEQSQAISNCSNRRDFLAKWFVPTLTKTTPSTRT